MFFDDLKNGTSVSLSMKANIGVFVVGYGGAASCGRQGLIVADDGGIHIVHKPYLWDDYVTNVTTTGSNLVITSDTALYFGIRKL